ncbi:unnamed protein product [Clonostachys rosea]|uniref:DUF1279 domain-containing protein n=1 Tax=Bionectria ochroleuca TaxID=29856 RepID=A0ABY6V175_BIOOC|nr:unnamed protein product [Clonostachys rosea]
MSRAWIEAVPRPLRSLRQPTTAWEPTWKRWSSSQSSQVSSHVAARASRGAANRVHMLPGRQTLFTPKIALRQAPRRGFRFTSWRRSAEGAAEVKESLSLSDRFKKLTREYGRAAVGVYFLLSILDMPFFFLLVQAVGTEKIAYVEHKVVSAITTFIPESVQQSFSSAWVTLKGIFKGKKTEDGASEPSVEGWGVEEAQERASHNASLATQLALAYAIHKSFIFVRIPLTVAVTPRIVKQLRAWGWNIGKKLVKAKAR